MNWQVTMISTKFLGPDGGYTSDAIVALTYLVDLKLRHGINVVATSKLAVGLTGSLLNAVQ